MDYCYKCGTEVQQGEKFCKNCGADLENNFHLTGISGECDKLKNEFDNCRCIKNISLNVIDPSRIDIKCLFSSFIYRRTPEGKPSIKTKNSILMTIFNIVFFVSAVVLIFTLETPAIKAVAAVFGILVAARFALIFARISERKNVKKYINSILGIDLKMYPVKLAARCALNCFWAMLALGASIDVSSETDIVNSAVDEITATVTAAESETLPITTSISNKAEKENTVTNLPSMTVGNAATAPKNDTNAVYIGDDVWLDKITDFSEGRAWVQFDEEHLKKGSEKVMSDFVHAVEKGKAGLIAYGILNYDPQGGEKLGLIDTNGKIITAIPIEYKSNYEVSEFENGTSYIKFSNNLYCIVDSDGNITYAHETEYGQDGFSNNYMILGQGDGLFLIAEHVTNFDTDEWVIGAIDKYGNEIAPFKAYEKPMPKGPAPVEPPTGDVPNANYDYDGYIEYMHQLDAYEQYVDYYDNYIPEKISFYGSYSEGLISCEYKGDGVFHLIFLEYGDILLNINSQSIIYSSDDITRIIGFIQPFKNGSSIMVLDNGMKYSVCSINTDGNITSALDNIWAKYAIGFVNINFSDGLVFVPYDTNEPVKSFIDKEYYENTGDLENTEKYSLYTGAFYDMNGNRVIDFPEYNGIHSYSCSSFHDGYASMIITGKDGKNYITAIDKSGNQMFEPKPNFNYANISDDGKYIAAINGGSLTVFDINGNPIVSINYNGINKDCNIYNGVLKVNDFYVNVETKKVIGLRRQADTNFSIELY